MRCLRSGLVLFQLLLLVCIGSCLSLPSNWNKAISSLVRRKGGGGGGKGGSSGSSSSGGSSSGGKPSSGGSSSTGSSSPSSNRGGSTSRGSGPSPLYGGGRYYGGGASVPYAAGQRSSRGLGPAGLLPVAGLGFFGGAWLAGAYYYPYRNRFAYYNDSSRNNETKPVICLCEQYSACGCDDNNEPQYVRSIIGNGNLNQLNTSLVRVADVNGTTTIVINGTLPNGTSAAGGEGLAAKSLANGWIIGWCALASMVAFLI